MADQPLDEHLGLRVEVERGVYWAAAEKWLVRGSTIVGFVLLGRLLGPDDFGVAALAMVFVTVLTVVADAGSSLFLLQRQDVDDRTTSTAFYISGAMGLVLASAVALSAAPIAALLDVPALRDLLPALSVALLLAAVSSVPAALMHRGLRFRELAMRQVLATSLSIVAAVGLALAGAGVWALVAQTLVRASVSSVVLWLTAGFRVTRVFSLPAAREMLSFGSRSVGVHLLKQLRNDGEVFVIGIMAGTTALGVWSVATRVVNVVLELVVAVFSKVSHPVFARIRGDRGRLAEALGSALAVSALVAVPLLVLLSLTSETVIPFVFGDQWQLAAQIAALLALRGIGTSLSELHSVLFLAVGRPGTELVVSVTSFLVQIGILLALAGDHLELAAIALAVWAAVSWPVRAVAAQRTIGVPWSTYYRLARVLLAVAVATVPIVAVGAVFDLSGWAFVAVATCLGAAGYVVATAVLCRRTVRDVLRSMPAPVRTLAQRVRS